MHCSVSDSYILLTVGLSLCLLCHDLSDSSSPTERTSVDQHLISSNDSTAAAVFHTETEQ